MKKSAKRALFIFLIITVSLGSEIVCETIGTTCDKGFKIKESYSGVSKVEDCDTIYLDGNFEFNSDCLKQFNLIPILDLQNNLVLTLGTDVFKNGGGLIFRKDVRITLKGWNKLNVLQTLVFEDGADLTIDGNLSIESSHFAVPSKISLLIDGALELKDSTMEIGGDSVVVTNSLSLLGKSFLNSSAESITSAECIVVKDYSSLTIFGGSTFESPNVFLYGNSSFFVFNKGIDVKDSSISLHDNSSLVFSNYGSLDRILNLTLYDSSSFEALSNSFVKAQYINSHSNSVFKFKTEVNYYSSEFHMYGKSSFECSSLGIYVSNAFYLHDDVQITASAWSHPFFDQLYLLDRSIFIVEQETGMAFGDSGFVVMKGNSRMIFREVGYFFSLYNWNYFEEESVVELFDEGHFFGYLNHFKGKSKLIIHEQTVSSVLGTTVFSDSSVLHIGNQSQCTFDDKYGNKIFTFEDDSRLVLGDSVNVISLVALELKNNAKITMNTNSSYDTTRPLFLYNSTQIVMTSNSTITSKIHELKNVELALPNSSSISVGFFNKSTLLFGDSTETVANEPHIVVYHGQVIFNPASSFQSASKQCIDAFSFNVSHNYLSLLIEGNTNLILFLTNRLLRYCPNNATSPKEIHCAMNGTHWGDPLNFRRPHCPCFSSSEVVCIVHTTQDLVFVGDEGVNVTFDAKYTNIIISEIETKRQDVRGNFKSITTSFGVKYYDGCSTNPQRLYSYDGNKYFFETICDGLKSKSFLKRTNQHVIINGRDIEISSPVLVFLNLSNDFSVFEVQPDSLLYSIVTSKNGMRINGNGQLCEIMAPIENSFLCLRNKSIECAEGYFPNQQYNDCLVCPSHCKRCQSSGVCDVCGENYAISEGKCSTKADNCIFQVNNRCSQCNNGQLLGGDCYDCSNDCSQCYENGCTICKSNSTILKSGGCVEVENVLKTSNEGINSCIMGYYVESNSCVECNSTFPNCKLCVKGQCILCSSGFKLNENMGCVSMNCDSNVNVDKENHCLSCLSGYSFNNLKECVETVDHCSEYSRSDCIECLENYYLHNSSFCSDEPIDNCILSTTVGCRTCNDSWFVNSDYACEKCHSKCLKCINKSNKCLKCVEGTFLNRNHECVTKKNLEGKCAQYTPAGGCIKCNEGYYTYSSDCLSCGSGCQLCSNEKLCIKCNSENFMNFTNECELKSNVVGCAVEIDSFNGCTQCSDGYFNTRKICVKCNGRCSTCASFDKCMSCSENYVLIGDECIHFEQINGCLRSHESRCSKCVIWHTPSEDGTFCKKRAEWWIIVLIILFAISLFCLCVYISFLVIKKIQERNVKKRQQIKACIFKVDKANVLFDKKLTKGIYSNKKVILFDDIGNIPIEIETKDLLCIANMTKKTVKLQITTCSKTDQYTLRINPDLVILKPKHACELEIYIKPLCTCSIKDPMLLTINNFKTNKEKQVAVLMKCETELSTRLDYRELIEDKEIGEGAFGVVFKGAFRGNKVAIKKLKNIHECEEILEEFKKEVAMLDKFRSEYIIHFYGAVMIPNRVCMVTEFAEFGSLNDLRSKNQINIPRFKIRVKFMIDAAKGIHYLHSNGILHRDIKPDNILVVSLDENEKVNAKLTDFGASRNINMLMTNMTFTKGVGTPVYMAPECLKKEKYKMAADIYSFAITMFECYKWGEAYVGKEFKFSWNIADFINKGNRLEKPESIPIDLYSLICLCWKQEPKERLKIDVVYEKLNEFFSTNF